MEDKNYSLQEHSETVKPPIKMLSRGLIILSLSLIFVAIVAEFTWHFIYLNYATEDHRMTSERIL